MRRLDLAPLDLRPKLVRASSAADWGYTSLAANDIVNVVASSAASEVGRNATLAIALAVLLSTIGLLLRLTTAGAATALLALIAALGTLAVIALLCFGYALHVRAMYERALHRFPGALVFTCMYTVVQQAALDRLADRVTVVHRLLPMRQYLFVAVQEERARFYSGWLRLDLRIELALRDLAAVTIEPGAVSDVRRVPSLALNYNTPRPVVARFPILAGNTSVFRFARTSELERLRIDRRLTPAT